MTDFTLRPWREADAASIARYADNAKIAANLRDVFPCPYARSWAAMYTGGAQSWATGWESPSGAAGS